MRGTRSRIILWSPRHNNTSRQSCTPLEGGVILDKFMEGRRITQTCSRMGHADEEEIRMVTCWRGVVWCSLCPPAFRPVLAFKIFDAIRFFQLPWVLPLQCGAGEFQGQIPLADAEWQCPCQQDDRGRAGHEFGLCSGR